MKPIRVLLVDDHALLRAGIRTVLADIPDVEIVGEAASGAEALPLVGELKPDVILTDISMPEMSGLELVERLVRDHPESRTIVLSMHTATEYVTHALRSGAAGYLVKDRGTDEIERAIRSVARGETYLCPVVSGAFVGEYVKLSDAAAAEADPLTPRQREILKMVAEGLPTKTIARKLDISAKTVETHRSQIKERLGIHDIAGLVRYAVKIGLVQSG